MGGVFCVRTHRMELSGSNEYASRDASRINGVRLMQMSCKTRTDKATVQP